MPPETSNPSPHQPSTFAPRPESRPAPSHAATACFWTVLLLFFAAIIFLGILAWTRNSGQEQPEPGINGHFFFALLLIGFAITTFIGVITTRHHHR